MPRAGWLRENSFMHHITVGLIALVALLLQASAMAQEKAATAYAGWKHSGSVYVLTTPEGANLPASASVEGFPLLVRLHKDWFDFAQAMANGEDIRFSTSAGVPLAYQIEEWDAAKGVASIWVRVPLIKGNERQEVRVHWGKADAAGNKVSATVSNTTDAAVQKTGEVKTAATTALKTEVKAVKETAAGTSASGSGSVQANSSANVAVSKQ